MKGLGGSIRRERLYILLLVFIVLVNVAASVSRHAKPGKSRSSVNVEAKRGASDLSLRRLHMEKVLREDMPLAKIFILASLLIVLLLMLGVCVEVILLVMRRSGRAMDISTCKLGVPRWDISDVVRVAVLFVFFGYILMMIESLLARAFPVIKNSDVRLIFNSSVLDILVLVFILYFAIGERGEDLRSLGVTFKNFFANVLYGAVGYLAALPVIFLTLMLTTLVAGIFKYVPKEQVVVDLFMRDHNAAFLLYTSVFAAIAGPVVEELFFRVFMYRAVKKHTGIFWATVISAALFAALHAHAVGFLPIMALGILLAILYERTGTLVAPVAVHMTHNLGMILLVFLAKAVRGS